MLLRVRIHTMVQRKAFSEELCGLNWYIALFTYDESDGIFLTIILEISDK